MDGTENPPRIGVIGLGMGLYLAEWSERVGLRVVAACDQDPTRLTAAGARLPHARLTEEWPDLLAPDLGLDGVIVANDFDAHAPLAIAFLERGVHVLSESAACADEVEARQLLAANERSTASYSFAENYVAHPHVRLIRQAVEAGELGRLTLVEADYLHGMAPEAVAELIKDPSHWRGRISPAAYCTHTLSPVLALTGQLPREVTAFLVDEQDARTAVVLVVRLSGGVLAICRHGFLQGEPDSHWSWLSVRGERGLAESVRGEGERAWAVRLRQEAWATPDGRVREEERLPPRLCLPPNPRPPRDPAGERPVLARDGMGRPAGARPVVERHVEGTVRVLTAFRDTLTTGTPPLVPLPAALAASLVGVAGARSLANGSRPVPVPDLVDHP